jgi:sialidase-1
MRIAFLLRNPFAVCLLILACAAPIAAQERSAAHSAATPWFESTNLWNANDGGYETYRIPGVVVTRRGTVLAYTSARSSPGDWADIDIVLRRSTDGGRSWSPSRVLAGEKKGVTDNPVAIPDAQTGAVHFLYQHDYARCYYMRSDDDGKTFTKPVDITDVFEQFRPEYDWHVIAPGVGHALQLKSGRLLVPIWMSTGAPTGPNSRAHRPSAVATIYSDDHGRTWHRGAIVINTTEEWPNPSESMAVQLSDGRVMMNIRNESTHRRRLVSISPDGISNWSTPHFDEQLFEPVCAASIVATPSLRVAGKPLLLFSNPDSEDIVGTGKVPYRARQFLTVRTSADDGTTWSTKKLIDPGVTGYSDLAVSGDGTIFVLYESGSIKGSETNNAHLVLARFNRAWLMSGTQER